MRPIIILVLILIFISGCQEKTFSENNSLKINLNYEFSLPEKWENPLINKIDIHDSLLTGICTNLQGNCGGSSGSNSVEAYCSDNPYLDCAEGDSCYVNPESPVCGVSHAELGDCYCLGDGICHDNFGEPIASPDCETCINGETQSCNLPYVPGTCGECNVGLKTCINNQWGSCEQIVDPVEEICDNGQDDDCDCVPDYTEVDCLTHLECNDEQCVEFPGGGINQCSIDLDCVAEEQICGDNNIQTPNDDGLNEICDGIDLGGEDCTTQGFDFGTLDCLTDCTGFDTSGCYDGGYNICNINGECVEVPGQGFDQCSSNNDCLVGSECGNGLAQPYLLEECDGYDLNGESCFSFGYSGGSLSCNADCTFNQNNCY